MLPWNIFENLHTVMANLVLFEQLLRQIFLNFFTRNPKSFIKYDVFCLQLSIMRAYGV